MARTRKPSLALREEEAWIAEPTPKRPPRTYGLRRAFLDPNGSFVTRPNAPLKGSDGCTVRSLDYLHYRNPTDNLKGA